MDGWVEANATPFVTRPEDVAEAAKLVRRFDLQVKTPDALHLAMTRRARATLWTLDRGMVRVAETISLSAAPRLSLRGVAAIPAPPLSA